jgi:Mg2+ and Co2+ transporter CorA
LHDIARHAIHVTETLDVSIQTLEYILAHHQDCLRLKHTISSGTDQIPQAWQDIHSHLSFLQSYLRNLRHRSISNEKRLQNEIQLAFNTVAQHDAALTVDISRAARLDSATMKTIAFVTLTFLPPTFICALFSMSFFNYSAESGWSVSREFWIYWAFAIPTTVVTVLVWQFWSKIVPHDRVETNKRDLF